MKSIDATDPTISVFAIRREDGKFFGGFDREKESPIIVDSVFSSKLFTNKHEVSLRPDEALVEVCIKMTEENTTVSTPFRLKRKPRTLTQE